MITEDPPVVKKDDNLETVEVSILEWKNKVDTFLGSLDVSPSERKKIREYVERLKEPNTSPINIIDEGRTDINVEILKSDFVRELAKEVFYKSIVKKDGLGSGTWTDYMEYFGIEESFFAQKDFDEFRKKNWINAITRGEQFSNKYQIAWSEAANEESKKKIQKEIDLTYGDFDVLGLTPKLPEVRKAALSGIQQNLTKDFQNTKEQRENRISGYKEFYEISEEDIDDSLVLSAKQNLTTIGREALFDLEEIKELTKNHPKFENYIKSDEVKLVVKEKIIESQSYTDYPKDMSDVMTFYSIDKSEIKEDEIDQKRRSRVMKSLQKDFQNDTDKQHIFFHLVSAQKSLTKEDWEKLFEKIGNNEKLPYVLGRGLDSDWEFEKNLKFIKSVCTSEQVRQGAIASIGYRYQQNTSLKREQVDPLAKRLGLTNEDVAEGLALGVLAEINRINQHNITHIKKEFEIKEMPDSPMIQQKLKEVSLNNIERGDMSILDLIDSTFNVNWEVSDKTARKEAVKEALTSGYVIRNFYSVERMRDFINKYYPETHKLEIVTDKDVIKSIEGILVQLPFNHDYQHEDKNHVDEMCQYFGLSKQKILATIEKRIENGDFISTDKQKYNFKKLFPEINLQKANARCLENHGTEIVEGDLENKAWSELRSVQKIADEELQEKISKFANNQIGILVDTGSSPNKVSYAIDFLLNNRELLGKISAENGEFERIKNILIQIPEKQMTESMWPFFYDRLKGITDEQFENRVNLVKKMVPHLEFVGFGKKSDEQKIDQMFSYTEEQQKEFFEILEMTSMSIADGFNDKNWGPAVMAYINAVEEANWIPYKNSKQELVDLFASSYKDVALGGMQKEWKEYLKDKRDVLPPNISFISNFIEHTGGAGTLKHVEALGNLIYKVETFVGDPKTVLRTTNEVKKIFDKQEKKFESEKVSQDDRSEFYNLSADIIEAAPSLFSAFSPVFEQLSNKEFKSFTKDIFPFYQAELIVVQEIENDKTTYKPKTLVEIRKALKDMAVKIKENPDEKQKVFEEEKIRLMESVKKGFKERFGLIKLPEEFNKEQFRSIQNAIRYMGNVNERDQEKEALISLYLGLELNGKWDEFRQGENIHAEEYLSEKQFKSVEPLLKEKEDGYGLLSEIVGVTKDKMPEFQKILQDDVISNMVGNIQTVDMKLGNIKRNIEELTDLDTYQSKQEKDTMTLLLDEKRKTEGDVVVKDGKSIGAVLAKTYSEASGKKVEMSESEKALQSRIAQIFGVTSWNTNEVKRIQDTIAPLGLIINMISKMEEENVEKNIDELQSRLVPNDKIIEIFNRIGEEFKMESGAIALSKDINYLESIIVKDEKKLTIEDTMEVRAYLDGIKEKMKELEGTLDKIKQYFDKMKKGSHLDNYPLLKDRFNDIEKIVNSKDEDTMIVSHMTKDLNLIIENMRQCLGCMRKEANNDTNLAFADYNKFFMFNQAGKDKGSVSDEIVFFAPISSSENKKEMSFVMDQIYGSKSSDILISNIITIFKKYSLLKKQSPEAKISITVTKSAMASVGLNESILKKRLENLIENTSFVEIENLIVDIPKSSFSDNYVEFGGIGARQHGERLVSGVVIK